MQKNGVTKHTIKIIIKTINKEAYGILKEAYETICLNQKYKGNIYSISYYKQ